jgi:hypothetical protein
MLYSADLNPAALEYMTTQLILTETFSELSEEEKMDILNLITDSITLYLQGCLIDLASKHSSEKH